MDTFTEFFIQMFFSTQREKSSFIRFNVTKTITPTVGTNSRTIFGNVEYKIKDEIRLSESFCLKIMPSVAVYEASNSCGFTNEIFFYSKILPFLTSAHSGNDLFPKFFGGFLHMNGKEENAMVILNNLQTDGYVGAKQPIIIVNFEHLSLMMRKLGEFHGLSYKIKSSDPNRFYSLGASCSSTILSVIKDVQLLILKGGNQVLQRLRKDPVYCGKLSNFEKIAENPQAFLIEGVRKYLNHPSSVFCHFSYRKDNVLFRYENGIPTDMKILDMAFMGLGSPWIDIALLLYFNSDQQMRDEHWDDLLDEYYKGCSETCSSEHRPTKDQIQKGMGTIEVCFAIFFIMCALPLGTSKENETAIDKHQSNEESKIKTSRLDRVMNITNSDHFLNIVKDALNRGVL